MKIKFHGNLGALKKRVAQCGVGGEWRYIARSGQHQFKAETGENLNWWRTTGTILFQDGGFTVLRERYMRRYLPREVHAAVRDR